MLGWKAGMTWKIKQRSRVPSLAAVMDPPDEIQEDVLTYKVIAEMDDHWEVKVGEGPNFYELHFFKEPLALKKVIHVDTVSPSCKVLTNEVLSFDAPRSYIDPLIGKQFPFIVDFPEIFEPIPPGQTMVPTVQKA